SEFVQGHAEEVRVAADGPALFGIQVQISGNGLGVGRGGVEGVAEHAAGAVEGVLIAMGAGGELDVDLASVRHPDTGFEVDLHVFGPFGERPGDFSSGGGRGEALGDVADDEAQACAVPAGPIPAFADL